MSNHAPIDFEHLARYTLGDAELEREIIGLFIDQAPSTMARLAPAAASRDWHEAAHTLKGSARAVGAWRIAELAERAETADTDPISRLEIRERLAAAIEDTRAFIAQRNLPHPAPAAE